MQQSGPGPNETRNLIIAVGLSALLFFGWDYFVVRPQLRTQQAERARVEAQTRTPEAQADRLVERDRALSDTAAQRVAIDTPNVDGSIVLEGGRFDDLNLRNYRRTLDRNSEEVTLLAPIRSDHGHDAFFGWEMRSGDERATAIADSASHWTAPAGARLGIGTPVTLTLTPAAGITIERTISIDRQYMFTIADRVRNASGAAVTVRPFGAVRRQGFPQDYKVNQIIHQGMTGAFGPNLSLRESRFEKARDHARDRTRGKVGEDQRIMQEQGRGGWFGITDHYWLAAIVLDTNEENSVFYDSRELANVGTDFRAAYRGGWRDVAAGSEANYTQRFYAGPKIYDLLHAYEEAAPEEARERGLAAAQPIPKFDAAIDWGMFWFLTRPFFTWLLHPLATWLAGLGVAVNFGIAILLSTIVIRSLVFPLIYTSYKSMAKLRTLAPKMKEVQEKYAADPQRQQQEMMKLYKVEKVNPVSGCLPMFLQIPVFYALYKTLSVTIEMRHAPFFGWIHDLSARDPTSLFNLFGLIPYDPHTVPLIGGVIGSLGAWPIMYGVSMWALQQLSPPPPDPMQARIFAFLPILFTFMFAAFPAGMVVYWTWSNVLLIAQQYVIMRRQGTETQFDILAKKLAERMKKGPAAAE